MPLGPYDSPILVLSHAPFPRGEENGLGEESSEQGTKLEQVCNEESISQLFEKNDTVDNGPLDEECGIEEVQMFHQRTRPYDLRNRKVEGPFTTSTPNNFSTPPNPNARNNPYYLKVPM